ncbi:MAG: NADH-ubiquinone oxidoreductase-F iron-sulfur binding region domain-containing protein, partial [Alphaproteobacteria bacterium]
VYVPKDSGARSVGADAVAAAFAAAGADVVRTGSRGLYWLEPMAEIETAAGRVAYGPLAPEDAATALAGGAEKRLGPVEELPALRRQTRMLFGRVGAIDPLDFAAYVAHGGGRGLAAAEAMAPADIVAAIQASGLRGRGGAGFPTGIKWRTVAEAEGSEKFVVCNADEGDSGAFADRMLMEGDPFLLLEGMAIAGRAVGAAKGYIYLRSEYPDAEATLQEAIRLAPFIGRGGFEVELRMGAGAYICGEETALLESLEGKRGMSRAKPPLPAIAGFMGRPTVVNNVLTLAAAPAILADGPEAHAALGYGRSRGTTPFQLSGAVRRPGLYELPFGATLRELVEDLGGGAPDGRRVRAVQVGGPLGAYFPASLMDTPLDYEAFAEAGGMLGHGGVVVFDDRVDLARQARYALDFCAHDSCGKCTPCRIGARRGVETIDRLLAGQDVAKQRAVLDDLLEVMRDGSLCALGGLTPVPVRSALDWFPEDFERETRP